MTESTVNKGAQTGSPLWKAALILFGAGLLALPAGAGTCEIALTGARTPAWTDLPVPIVLTDGEEGFTAADCASDGADLCVTDATPGGTGAALPCEIECWNPGGRSVVWVKVPNPTAATVLRFAWGADAGEPVREGVWTDVWTVQHMVNAPSTVEGPLGPAAQVVSVGNAMTVSSVPPRCNADTGTFSVSFRLKLNTLADDSKMYIFKWSPDDGLNKQFAAIFGFTSGGYVELFNGHAAVVGDDPRPHSAIKVPDLGWHEYAYTYDGTTLRCYRDAQLVNEKELAMSLATANVSGSVVIGGSSGSKDLLNGCVDEFRMAGRAFAWADVVQPEDDGGVRVSFQDLLNPGHTDIRVPFFLREGESGFHYSDYAADGSNLRVEDVTGGSAETEPLPCEIERWNPNGTSLVWTRVPKLDASTQLRLKSGESANGGVWDDDALWMVQHMADAPDTEEGPLGAAARFGTTGSTITVLDVPANPSDYSGPFSLSFWLRLDTLEDGSNMYVCRWTPGGLPNAQLAVIFGFTSGGYLELYNGHAAVVGDDPRPHSAIKVPDLKWHHYAYTYDGSRLRRYRDGELLGIEAINMRLNMPTSQSGSLIIGGSSAEKDFLRGAVDEFRMAGRQFQGAEIESDCETQSADFFDEGLDMILSECAVTEPLVDFPALLMIDRRCAGYDFARLNQALTRGGLRVCVAGSRTRLPLERETISADEEGTISLWTRVPQLDATTRLRVCWPNFHVNPDGAKASISDANHDLWSDEFALVWHLSNGTVRRESVHGGGLLARGELAGAYPPTADGPTGSYAAMRTGAGLGTVQSWTQRETKGLGNVFTISFWARRDDFENPSAGYLFLARRADGSQRAIITGYSGRGNKIWLYGGAEMEDACLSIPDADWHHYAFVCDGAALTGYVDGEVAFTNGPVYDFGIPSFTSLNTLTIGNSNANDPFIGALDEFRIECTARSANWIRACVRNQTAWRQGMTVLNAPGFVSDAGSATVAGSAALRFAAQLNGKAPAQVTFHWGTAEGGTAAADWPNAVPLGEMGGEDALTSTVEGVSPGARVYGRFCASNEHGLAWSRPLCGCMPGGGGRRARISFAGYSGAPLTNFPVCVRFVPGSLSPARGESLVFETADGQTLPFEVECWDPVGECVAWVRVPRLDAATQLTARWGRADTEAAAWPRAAVWDDDYVRVYHMAPNGLDSSRHAAHVVQDAISADAAGPSGRCRAFDGTNGKMTMASRPFCLFGDGFTISFNARFDDAERDQYFFNADVSLSGTRARYSMIYGYKDGILELHLSDIAPNGGMCDAVRTASEISSVDADWHHYAYTSDGRVLTAYRDGVVVKTTWLPYTLAASNVSCLDMPIDLGGGTGKASEQLKGALDELRLERTCRSADWVRAMDANQRGTLCTVGSFVAEGTVLFLR